MAPRNRNRNNQGGGNSKKQVAQSAAPQVQQAPYPESFAKNPPPLAANYVPGLMVPGNDGYRPEYGGGGWVAGLREYNGPNYNSIADVKDWYRAMAATGGAALGSGSWADIRAAAATYDPSKFGTSSGSTTTTQPSPTAQSYKGIGSINAGLKIGGDNILGKREAGRIARNTGKSYDDVITKALGRGMSIGGGAVRKSNRAAGGSQVIPTIQGQRMFINGSSDDPLSQMRRINPGRRQMYSGTYELDGKTTPLVESRRGGMNPLTIGGGKGKRGNKGRNKGGGGMTDSETTFGDTAPQSMDYTPITPQQMETASSTDGPGMLSGGGMGSMGATGLRRPKSRLRQLGIYGRGTSLLGRGLQYGNTLNA